MRTQITLKPGQKGTEEMLLKYGPRLLAVHHVECRGRRLRTVELVEEIAPPSVPGGDKVLLRIGANEVGLQQQVWMAGGRWLRDVGMWEVGYAAVLEMGLEGRVL